jgi:hypothetical protein
VITLSVLTALLLQTIFEFGPLWLVALAVPAILYGPYWAGLMTTLGFGGMLAGRVPLHRPAVRWTVVAAMSANALTLTFATNAIVVTLAQVLLALLTMIASIYVTHLLHDAVPSTIRSGVASGVGALSWLAFLPFALAFGVVSDEVGVLPAGWLLAGTTVLAGLLLVWAARGAQRRETPAVETGATAAPEAALAA